MPSSPQMTVECSERGDTIVLAPPPVTRKLRADPPAEQRAVSEEKFSTEKFPVSSSDKSYSITSRASNSDLEGQNLERTTIQTGYNSIQNAQQSISQGINAKLSTIANEPVSMYSMHKTLLSSNEMRPFETKVRIRKSNNLRSNINSLHQTPSSAGNSSNETLTQKSIPSSNLRNLAELEEPLLDSTSNRASSQISHTVSKIASNADAKVEVVLRSSKPVSKRRKQGNTVVAEQQPLIYTSTSRARQSHRFHCYEGWMEYKRQDSSASMQPYPEGILSGLPKAPADNLAKWLNAPSVGGIRKHLVTHRLYHMGRLDTIQICGPVDELITSLTLPPESIHGEYFSQLPLQEALGFCSRNMTPGDRTHWNGIFELDVVDYGSSSGIVNASAHGVTYHYRMPFTREKAWGWFLDRFFLLTQDDQTTSTKGKPRPSALLQDPESFEDILPRLLPRPDLFTPPQNSMMPSQYVDSNLIIAVPLNGARYEYMKSYLTWASMVCARSHYLAAEMPAHGPLPEGGIGFDDRWFLLKGHPNRVRWERSRVKNIYHSRDNKLITAEETEIFVKDLFADLINRIANHIAGEDETHRMRRQDYNRDQLLLERWKINPKKQKDQALVTKGMETADEKSPVWKDIAADFLIPELMDDEDISSGVEGKPISNSTCGNNFDDSCAPGIERNSYETYLVITDCVIAPRQSYTSFARFLSTYNSPLPTNVQSQSFQGISQPSLGKHPRHDDQLSPHYPKCRILGDSLEKPVAHIQEEPTVTTKYEPQKMTEIPFVNREIYEAGDDSEWMRRGGVRDIFLDSRATQNYAPGAGISGRAVDTQQKYIVVMASIPRPRHGKNSNSVSPQGPSPPLAWQEYKVIAVYPQRTVCTFCKFVIPEHRLGQSIPIGKFTCGENEGKKSTLTLPVVLEGNYGIPVRLGSETQVTGYGYLHSKEICNLQCLFCDQNCLEYEEQRVEQLRQVATRMKDISNPNHPSTVKMTSCEALLEREVVKKKRKAEWAAAQAANVSIWERRFGEAPSITRSALNGWVPRGSIFPKTMIHEHLALTPRQDPIGRDGVEDVVWPAYQVDWGNGEVNEKWDPVAFGNCEHDKDTVLLSASNT